MIIKGRSTLKLAKGTQKSISGWGLDKNKGTMYIILIVHRSIWVTEKNPVGNNGEMAGSRQIKHYPWTLKCSFLILEEIRKQIWQEGRTNKHYLYLQVGQQVHPPLTCSLHDNTLGLSHFSLNAGLQRRDLWATVWCDAEPGRPQEWMQKGPTAFCFYPQLSLSGVGKKFRYQYKSNKPLITSNMWMALKDIILSKKCQPQKVMDHIISLT